MRTVSYTHLDVYKRQDVYISGGYGLFKEALQIVDKMYITEVDLNIEDGDTFRCV